MKAPLNVRSPKSVKTGPLEQENRPQQTEEIGRLKYTAVNPGGREIKCKQTQGLKNHRKKGGTLKQVKTRRRLVVV